MDATAGAIARYQRDYAVAMPNLRVVAGRNDLEWLRVVAQTGEGFRSGTHFTSRNTGGGGSTVPAEMLDCLQEQRDVEAQFQKQDVFRGSIGSRRSSMGAIRRKESSQDLARVASLHRKPSFGGKPPMDSPRSNRPSPRGPTVVTHAMPQSPEEHAAELRRERREIESEERRQRTLYSGVWLDQWHCISRDCRSGASKLNVPTLNTTLSVSNKDRFGSMSGTGGMNGSSGSGRAGLPPRLDRVSPRTDTSTAPNSGRPTSARNRPTSARRTQASEPQRQESAKPDLGRRWVHDAAAQPKPLGRLPPVQR